MHTRTGRTHREQSGRFLRPTAASCDTDTSAVWISLPFVNEESIARDVAERIGYSASVVLC